MGTTALLIALGSLMLALGVASTGIAWHIRGTLDSILHRLLKLEEGVNTRNGMTIGKLAERTEGRRIEEDVKVGDQTPSEKRYVDALHEGGRDL